MILCYYLHNNSTRIHTYTDIETNNDLNIEIPLETTAQTVHEAINELNNGSSGSSTAINVSYDNTSSSLTATNVQDAIDELSNRGGSGGTTINITTTTSSFYGRTITIAGDYATYTATFSSSGIAQCMVYYVDEYDIYIDSYHNPLNVTAMGLVYNTTLDSDYKTINISTTNTNMYGMMINLKYNGVTRLSLTFDPDNGTCSARVGQTGTWSITSTLSSIPESFTVTELDKDTQSVTYVCVENTSWSTASIDEIKAMIQLADNGAIDIADHWTVGEERTISFTTTVCGSSSAVWVITDLNGTTSGGTSYNAVIHSKNCLTTSRYMNSSNTTSNGWNSSYMRNTVMSEVYSGLESTFKSIIKQASIISSAGNGSDTIQTTSHYIWLFSNKEVQGGTGDSGSTEADKCKQMKYFETSSNKVKTGNTSSYNGYWWLRSPNVGATRGFCIVRTNGGAGHADADFSYGVVPAAII